MVSAEEVARHNTRESCWVVIQGRVYDVTDFLDEHPAGANIILRFGGKDATEEYLPVHPPGTIEKELPSSKHLGSLDPTTVVEKGGTISKIVTSSSPQKQSDTPLPIELCVCLDDFELAAKGVLSQRAWTYYSSGAENLHSQRLNREDWERVLFRPRVLRNVRRVHMSCRILGHDTALPFFIAPVALGRLGHVDGELCLARAAARYNIPYAVSTASSVAAEDLVGCVFPSQGRGCLFFQLYVKKKRSETLALIERAKRLGFKGLVITVDTPVVGKRELDDKYKIQTALDAGDPSAAMSVIGGPPNKEGEDEDEDTVFRGPYSSSMCWEDLAWMMEAWGDANTVCIKGVAAAEDAELARRHGIKTIYLSNHGGRQLDSAPSALRTLVEIRRQCPQVLEECAVLLDGGIRRATDALKALCLGARAVGIGRPMMYAMSAYGTEGVCKAIQVLSDELQTSMRLLGVTSLDQLGPHLVSIGELDSGNFYSKF